MFLIDISIYIYIYKKGIFPFSPFKPLATVSNPISSNQNNSNSLVLALPRVLAVNTIDHSIIYQSTLVSTRVANQSGRHFFPNLGRLQSLSTYKGKWANSHRHDLQLTVSVLTSLSSRSKTTPTAICFRKF